VTDALWTAGVIGAVVGLAIAALAVIAMIINVRDPAQRTRAYGFALVGMSVVSLSGAILLVSRLGDRLPILAGLPPIALLLVVGLILRLAASREFRLYRSYRSEG
jgi:hypothetical protein